MSADANKVAVVYVRVSTEEQAEHGYSLAAQRQECQHKAQLLGADQVEEYADEGISGSILERPGLMKALGRVKRGGVRWFIALDTSRLSRAVVHQLLLVDEIHKAGTELLFVHARFGDSPEDRFHLTVMGAVDEYERARTRLRSLIGKRQKAAQGGLTHSPGLYGYHFDKETDTLKVVPSEAEVVRLLFSWLVGNQISPHLMAKRLNDMGIPSPRGKSWSRQTVRRILANSAYAGTLYLHRYDTKDVKFNRYKAPEDRAKRTERPREEWLPIAVESIIEHVVWEQAQEQLNSAQRKWRAHSKYPYLLSGLCRCGLCGATMHGNLVTVRGAKRAYYVCTAKSPGIVGTERCRSASVEAAILDDLIWQRVAWWLTKGAQVDQLDGQGSGSVAGAQELALVERELARVDDERSRVVMLFQKQLLPEQDAEARLNGFKEQWLWLTARRDQLVAKIEPTPGEAQPASKAEIHPAPQQWLSQDFALRQALIQLLIQEIAIGHEQVTIRARLPDQIPDGPDTVPSPNL